MTASLTIEFDDGTTKTINLGSKCIEIDIPNESKQSLCINQRQDGEFRLSFTRPIMDGKRFRKITLEKT